MAPDVNYVSTYKDYLPPFLWSPESDSDQFLLRFLCAFEAILTGRADAPPLRHLRDGQYLTDLPYEEIINRLPGLFDPWRVPVRFLPFLAGCLGLDLDPTWDEYRKRRMIEGASALFQQRWLKQGLYAYFRIATASAAVRPRVAVDDGEALLRGALRAGNFLRLTPLAFARPATGAAALNAALGNPADKTELNALLAARFGAALSHPTALAVAGTKDAPYYVIGDAGPQDVPLASQRGYLWRVSQRGLFLDWRADPVNKTPLVPFPLNGNDPNKATDHPLKTPVAIVVESDGVFLVLDAGGTVYRYTVTTPAPGSISVARTTVVAANLLNAVKPVDMLRVSAGNTVQVLVLDQGGPPPVGSAVKPRLLRLAIPTTGVAPDTFPLGDAAAARPTGMVLEPAGTLLITDAGPAHQAGQGDVLRMKVANGESAKSLLKAAGANTGLANPVSLALLHDGTTGKDTLLVLDNGLNTTPFDQLTEVLSLPARLLRMDPGDAAPVPAEVTFDRPLVAPSRVLFDPFWDAAAIPRRDPEVLVLDFGDSNQPTPGHPEQGLDWRCGSHYFGVTVHWSAPDFVAAGITDAFAESVAQGSVLKELINVLDSEKPAHATWLFQGTKNVG
jgi:phage tail-like protein